MCLFAILKLKAVAKENAHKEMFIIRTLVVLFISLYTAVILQLKGSDVSASHFVLFQHVFFPSLLAVLEMCLTSAVNLCFKDIIWHIYAFKVIAQAETFN
jgi:hypothetical protein